MVRVVLAEDDPSISDVLIRNLEREGYHVALYEDGESALAAARSGPDIVILDIGLPKMDGIDVVRRLREEGHTVPVLMLTARADQMDVVVGLDAGADDYVTKPAPTFELMARVRAVLRRNQADGALPTAHGAEEESHGSDEVRIDTEGRRAWFRDEEMHLTAKEFDLLRVLVREQGKVCTRENLMREIWDTAWLGSTKTLDMHISGLRRKLGDDATAPRYISTVRGVGFRFERPDDVA